MKEYKLCPSCPYNVDTVHKVYMAGNKSFCSPECLDFIRARQEEQTRHLMEKDRQHRKELFIARQTGFPQT